MVNILAPEIIKTTNSPPEYPLSGINLNNSCTPQLTSKKRSPLIKNKFMELFLYKLSISRALLSFMVLEVMG